MTSEAVSSVTCPHLRETFHNPLTCMYCVPTNPVRHCCRKHETEDLKGGIFGRNFIVCPICWDKRCARAEDCANACTGQQPAQPGSGERIRPRGRLICVDCRNEFIDPWRCTTCGAQRLYDETVRQQAAKIDRLQSALTAAQQRIATMRAKLLELAGECAECGGSGETTIRGMCGGVEMDCDDQPCPECEDIREAAR